MDLKNLFGTDPDTEVVGTWVPLLKTEDKDETGEKTPPTRFLIARRGNRIHSKMMSELYKANRVTLENKDIDVSTKRDEELSIDAIARAILKGWENVVFDGKSLEYSYENAVMLLQMSDFRAWIMAHAGNMELFKIKQVEAAKNG